MRLEMKNLQQLGCLLFLLSSSAIFADSPNTEINSNVVQADEIKWGYLNPLRGDKSPGAAELWGDRTKDMATGMLVKFNKGFSSPPHIHNISYRGIVIEGLMHNDDPNAAEMWMPQGSFWTQPAGEDHITAASGQSNLIYLEIDSGPYLVKPSDNGFNNGESPINLHVDNIPWLQANDVSFVHSGIKTTTAVKLAPLWGSTKNGELGGILLKLPAGFSGTLDVDAPEFRAVVIKGSVQYQSQQTKLATDLTAGSYFDSKGKFAHQLSLSDEALVYVRTNGRFNLL